MTRLKKPGCLLLALLLALALAACGGAPAATATPAPTPAPTEAAPDLDAAALAFTEKLLAGDYEGCCGMFAQAVAMSVSPEAIRSAWEGSASSLGGFVGVEEARTLAGSYSYMQYREVFCEFEDGGLVAVLLFAGTEQPVGFSVLEYLPESALDFDTVTEAKPLLWRVTSPEGATLYLFGSIHAADDGLYALPEAVMSAYDACDALALELDIVSSQLDLAASLETQQAMMYADGSSLADHLKPATYEKVRAFLDARGLWDANYDLLAPYALYSSMNQLLIEDAGLAAARGVDMYLNSLALSEGKEILEVEGMAFQMAGMLAQPDIYWDCVLSDFADSYDEAVAELQELYEVYRSGDEAAFAALALAEETPSPDDPALAPYDEAERAAILAAAEDLNAWMLPERNAGMAEKALGYMAEGKTVFFVVGAAHMAGDEGLVSLLRAAGCAVERVEY